MENRGGECRERDGKSRILRNLVYDCGRVPGAWRQAMLCVRSVTGTSTSMNVRTHFTSHHGGFFRRHSAIGGVFNSRQASDVPFRHLQQSAELDRHDEKGLREKNRQSSETEHDGKVHARKTQRGLLIHIHCLLLDSYPTGRMRSPSRILRSQLLLSGSGRWFCSWTRSASFWLGSL